MSKMTEALRNQLELTHLGHVAGPEPGPDPDPDPELDADAATATRRDTCDGPSSALGPVCSLRPI